MTINNIFTHFENGTFRADINCNGQMSEFLVYKNVFKNSDSPKVGRYSFRISDITFIRLIKFNVPQHIKSIDFIIPIEPEERGFKVYREVHQLGNAVDNAIYRYINLPTALKVAEYIILNYDEQLRDLDFQLFEVCKVAQSG